MSTRSTPARCRTQAARHPTRPALLILAALVPFTGHRADRLSAQQAQEPASARKPKLYAHEPEGFTRFAEFDGSDRPPSPIARANLAGKWYNFPPRNPNLTLERDPDAPVSPPMVVSTRYPAGMRAGVGPVNFGGWDERLPGEDSYKSKMYISMWVKIKGPGFENNKGGTKVGFIGVGNKTSGHAELFFWLDNGMARQRVQEHFKMLFKQQAIPQPNGWVVRNMDQNVSRQALIGCDRWQQWEAVLELNDMGQANGIFRMWIDGVMTHDYHNVTYITPKTPVGFNLFKWNPTWGGEGGRKTKDDYILIDHIYISGEP